MQAHKQHHAQRTRDACQIAHNTDAVGRMREGIESTTPRASRPSRRADTSQHHARRCPVLAPVLASVTVRSSTGSARHGDQHTNMRAASVVWVLGSAWFRAGSAEQRGFSVFALAESCIAMPLRSA
jgi:hypothetical protein